MNLVPVSVNGLTLNDSTFKSVFPGDGHINGSPVQHKFSARSNADPLFAVDVVGPKKLDLYVSVLDTTTPHTRIDTLNKYLHTKLGQNPTVARAGGVQLIAKDTDDSDRQWYLYVLLDSQPRWNGTLCMFKLVAAYGLWRTVVTKTDTSWSLTASGQTHDVSPSPVGNFDVTPVVTLTPTSAKTGAGVERWDYRRPVIIYSKLDSAFTESIDITGGGLDTAALVGFTGISNQINQGGGINAVVTTIPIDTAVGGGLPGAGMGYVDTEQISWTANSGSSLTGVIRGLNGTTAATHADNAVIKLSKMQAEGDDLRAIVGNVERDRWLQSPNNAATKMWVNLTFSARAEPLILTAIAGAGSITTIDFVNTKANIDKFKKLPKRGTLLIDSEAFTYTDIDYKALTVSGVKRTQYGTTIGAHSSGATARWIEHEIWITYGDATLSAPTVDDTLKPMFELTSTNGSHAYLAMASNDGRRMSQWKGAIVKPRGDENVLYTGNHEAEADPATEMGMSIRSWLSGKRYQDGSAEIFWQIQVPQGVTEYAYTSEKYRKITTWPKLVGLQYSVDGKKFFTVDTIATPADNTWTDDDQTTTAFPVTVYYVRFVMSGGVSAGEDYRASWEIDDVTLTIASGGTPSVTVGAEIANYDLNAKVENTTNGSYFTVRWQGNLNDQMEINCATKECTNLTNNVRGPIVETPDGQTEWLILTPGVTNTLKVTEPGLTGMDVDLSWQDRQI